MRKNDEIQRENKEIKNSASGWRSSHPVMGWPSPFNSTWPSPAPQTVTTPWRADRHALWRPSRVRENQSPPPETVFPDFSPTLSTCRDTRPEHVVKEDWPINRSKEEKERVEEFRQALVVHKHFVICILVSIWFKSVTKETLFHCNFQFNSHYFSISIAFSFTGYFHSVASVLHLFTSIPIWNCYCYCHIYADFLDRSWSLLTWFPLFTSSFHQLTGSVHFVYIDS